MSLPSLDLLRVLLFARIFFFQEPYASMHIAFHDGVFDHGSRLFSALHSSWYNSTEDSSDVNASYMCFFLQIVYFQIVLLARNRN